MTGRTLAHYRILDKLGGGGRSTVRNAEGTKLQRLAGFQSLPQEMATDRPA